MGRTLLPLSLLLIPRGLPQGCSFGAAAFAACTSGFAQGFPAKPIRLIVAYPPGGNVDVVARLVSPGMSEGLGQPVVIEYRGGANGMIGTAEVARAAPDGHTITLGNVSTHVASKLLSKSVPYDAQRDFTPITMAVEPVTFLVVHPSVPATTVRELIEHARRNPGKLAYASNGIGSNLHLQGELFKVSAGVDLIHVPYKGVGPAVTDTMAGQVHMTFTSPSAAATHMRSGKLRLLATLEASRYPGLPDVPTIAETVPGFEKPAAWFGFFGPAGLPAAVLARLHRDAVRALTSRETRAKLEEGGFAIVANTPERFAVMHQRTLEVYARAIKAAGIQPE